MGLVQMMIPRGATIPTRMERETSTSYDNQTEMHFTVWEGGVRPMLKDNNFLGELWFRGIPAAPGGVPQLILCFEIDVDGNLEVSVEDKKTRKKEKIRIKKERRVSSEEEINRILKDRCEWKDAEETFRAKAKFELKEYVYKLSKTMEDCRTLSWEDRNRVMGAIEAAIEWVKAKQMGKRSEFEAKKERA